ncbi:cytochrome-c peroxidase [Fulvivirgaceae bacterium PWU20]|uniref:Cytochrome-c peroxidase n=2 Tax=Chryseosolibacter indicus TaxID=2782351 RepID=A0ABS5VSM2_9BACT|nr:cytochrome-c peroxidase [Chryseosolibacter indicus]
MYITKRAMQVMVNSLLTMLFISCLACTQDEQNEEDVIKDPAPVRIDLPSNFPPVVYDLGSNPVTQEGIELGKKIFYDTRLSRNNTISCGFCHQQQTAFTHHGHDVSHGIDDKLGRRNSLPIQNLLFYKTFFWDGGVHNLDLVALNAITNAVEMDENVPHILAKLENDAAYKKMFKAAFKSEEITSTKFLQALSQFLATMISANSTYDMYIRKERGVTLSESELKGLELFKQKCAGCHATDLFTDQTYRNNGFSSPADLGRDSGREEITLNPEDRGKFKVPSLRNVEYTAPYMHNGKLQTLEEVLNFYSSGVHETPTLDSLLRSEEKPGIQLTATEKQNIIAFLKTLTDEQYVGDRKFSEF